MKIDCISDLHGHFPKLCGGDILIIAGDLTATGTIKEFNKFADWLKEQDYKKKVFIAGNHDPEHINGIKYLEWLCRPFAEYLCDSGTEYKGVKIWGSPWTRWFHGINPKCKAFVKRSEEELQEKWDLIPTNIDILVTHMPPYGVFDKIKYRNEEGIHVGSTSLSETIRKKNFVRLHMHVFGHIHEHGGKVLHLPNKAGYLINASHVNEVYNPIHDPVSIEAYFHNIKNPENIPESWK